MIRSLSLNSNPRQGAIPLSAETQKKFYTVQKFKKQTGNVNNEHPTIPLIFTNKNLKNQNCLVTGHKCFSSEDRKTIDEKSQKNPLKTFAENREKIVGKAGTESLSHLLEKNKIWSTSVTTKNPSFFKSLVDQQSPELLWIGCSDSRVPANQIIDLAPGEVFVHRNIANVVVHTDLNCLSVLQFAVEVLKVKHVIVCGHYGCGGVKAALSDKQFGLIDNWLRHIKDVYTKNKPYLESLKSDDQKLWETLTELNVLNSVHSVCETTIVQNAWSRGQPLSVHGWCYRLNDGRINDLGVTVSSSGALADIYRVQK